jgi:hypothetical protein
MKAMPSPRRRPFRPPLCAAPFPSRRVGAARWAAVLPALLLAACGGGFSLYIGSDYDLSPPSISLAAPQSSVVAGETVRFVAAAADENGIDFVEFFRLDGSRSELLGTDRAEPWEWNAVAPSDGRSRLSVWARAFDRAGNRADSAVVDVSIVP